MKNKVENLKINLTEEAQTLLQLFNIVSFTLMICGAVSFILAAVLHFAPLTLVLMICEEISLMFGIFIANVLKHPRAASVLVCLVTNNLVLPILFILGGGIQGGVFIWFVIGLILPWIFLSGLICYVVFGLNIFGTVLAVVLSLVLPGLAEYKHDTLGTYVSVVSAVIILIVVFGVIITYQKRIHEIQRKQLIEAMEKTQVAIKSKNEFFTNLTHDIRTPMNAVVGFTEIARRNVDDKNKVYDCLNKISMSGNHLVSLIDGVLDLAKLESGQEAFKSENVNLKQMTEQILAILHYEIEEKQLNINLNLNTLENEYVICDSVRLKQILINVLSNATKYSKLEGNIYFSITEKKSDEPEKRKYVFFIKDEGCGMTPEQLSHVFEPLNQTSRHKNKGTGLGLSITKKIVDIMGGSIQIYSEYDKGTEVKVVLTLPVSNLYELSDENSGEKLSFTGNRILVVDDNELNCELTAEILNAYDFEIDTALAGSVAVEKIRTAPDYFYDAVLMDIAMPGINGYEATKIIRSTNKSWLDTLPIIALSANAFEEDKRKAMEVGMNGYITKPFNSDELIKVLQLVLKDEYRQNLE